MTDSAGYFALEPHQDGLRAPSPEEAIPLWGSRLRKRVEPSVAELVGTAVAFLQAAGLPSVPVVDPQGRAWPPAYVLGRLSPQLPPDTVSGMALAEVVLDSAGRMVRNHPVQVVRSERTLRPVSCTALAYRYEQFISATRLSQEPEASALAMTRQGELLICGPGSEPVPLADYLNGLCRSATGRTPAL